MAVITPYKRQEHAPCFFPRMAKVSAANSLQSPALQWFRTPKRHLECFTHCDGHRDEVIEAELFSSKCEQRSGTPTTTEQLDFSWIAFPSQDNDAANLGTIVLIFRFRNRSL